MWPICKKELRQFFSSLTGYIAIIVFLLVNGLVLFVLKNNILEFGYATLDQFFSFAPWVMMFLVSAICMRSFSEEFKSGTFEILGTKPLSSWQIVSGKFFGAFIVALIALIPTLVYYFTVNHLAATSGIDSGAAAGSYLGLILLTGVFTAIDVCISSFTTNSVVAFIISLIACVLFYYGFSALSELSPFKNGTDYYIEMVGINFHYQSLSKGNVYARDMIYFISLISFFLLITRLQLSKNRSSVKAKDSVKWITSIAGLFLINFLATNIHLRFDLTEDKRYSLTQPTKEMIRNLNSDVAIDVFLKGDFPSGFKKLSNSTQEFLSIVKDINPARIQYRFISPEDDAGNSKTWSDSLRSAGIEPINLSVQVKAGEEKKNIFPYALIHINGRTDVINLFPSSKRNVTDTALNNAEAMMEFNFASSLYRFNNFKLPTVAYAIGNGEPEGPETFSLQHTLDPQKVSRVRQNPKFFDSSAQSSYRFGIHNISEYKTIPNAIDVLLIVKPSKQFSEADKLKIDQYVMHGGKVIWFIDNLFAEQDSLGIKPDLVAYDRNLNLNDLLFDYGVRINGDLLMDLQCDFLQLNVGGTQENPQYEFLKWNYWPFLESSEKHSIVKSLGLVEGRFVNSIDTVEAGGVFKTILLQSSSASRKISTPAIISLNENKNLPEHEKYKAKGIPAAVLLEGQFTSLYKNRVSKAQQDSLQEIGGFKENSDADGKMIVVSDGDIILNDLSYQEGPLPMGYNANTIDTRYQYPVANRSFLLNCLEYLTGNSNIIKTRNKEIFLRLLDPKKTEAEKTKWQLINIALPILLVIIFGFIYQRFRRYRFAS